VVSDSDERNDDGPNSPVVAWTTHYLICKFTEDGPGGLLLVVARTDDAHKVNRLVTNWGPNVVVMEVSRPA